MTDTTYDRSLACNLVILAHLPTEDLVAAVFALEDRHLPAAGPARSGAAIQRDLVVLSLFRGYLLSGQARGDAIRADVREAFLATPLERFVGPPGEAIRTLRSEFLVDPDLDLAPDLARAAALQAVNSLPAEVPPLGRIITKAQTLMAPDDQPLVAPPAMKTILMAQACLRAMLDMRDRRPSLLMRTAPSDPAPLRNAQILANAILASRAPHTPVETAAVAILGQTVCGHLEALRFPVFAGHLAEFLAMWTGQDREGDENVSVDAASASACHGEVPCPG
jgi:hypothetical protein